MKKITILLAEDHEIVRQGIRQFLERESDLEVVGEAGDGEEAVRLRWRQPQEIRRLDKQIFLTYRFMSGQVVYAGEWYAYEGNGIIANWLPRSPV